MAVRCTLRDTRFDNAPKHGKNLMSVTLETLVRRNDSVLFAGTADSITMMDIEKGDYYDIEGSAARIWELLEEPRTAAALVATLRVEFDVDDATCQADTIEFIDDLIKSGVVSTC